MTRNPMLAKIHIARKDLGLDEDTYRDLLARVTGKRSAADLSDADLDAVLAEFKRLGFKTRSTPAKRAGKRPLAASPHAGKIRALWLALYNLGLAADSSEAALARFVARQAKVDALQWLSAQQADRVIEALKSWASRDAGVDWSPVRMTNAWFGGRPISGLVDQPKVRVIEAQWRRLAAIGAVRSDAPPMRDAYVQTLVKSPCAIGLVNLTDAQADRVIETLGRKLRAAIAAKAAKEA